MVIFSFVMNWDFQSPKREDSLSNLPLEAKSAPWSLRRGCFWLEASFDFTLEVAVLPLIPEVEFNNAKELPAEFVRVVGLFVSKVGLQLIDLPLPLLSLRWFVRSGGVFHGGSALEPLLRCCFVLGCSKLLAVKFWRLPATGLLIFHTLTRIIFHVHDFFSGLKILGLSS